MGKWKKRKAKSNGNESQGDSNKANNTEKKSENTMVYKFAPMTSDRSVRYATYDKVKERIVLRVQTEYDDGEDITETLRLVKTVDMQAASPRRLRSKETDPQLRADENEDFEKLHDKQLDAHIEREKDLQISHQQGVWSNLLAVLHRGDENHNQIETGLRKGHYQQPGCATQGNC